MEQGTVCKEDLAFVGMGPTVHNLLIQTNPLIDTQKGGKEDDFMDQIAAGETLESLISTAGGRDRLYSIFSTLSESEKITHHQRRQCSLHTLQLWAYLKRMHTITKYKDKKKRTVRKETRIIINRLCECFS